MGSPPPSPPARVVLGALAVLLFAVIALGLGALHSNHLETRLTTAAATASAQRSDRYYNCLSAQAHSLITPSDVVYLPDPTLAAWTTLTKVVGGWAHVTLQLHQANLALTLQRSTHPGSCDGNDLVTVGHAPGGHIVIRSGS